ncbi:MAG TPA: hypothetical protein VLA12_19445, partial [Planctomycetaceae bacterium]|nr:hypothetical protein [Planctomycetaceae bacterium]
MLSQTDHNATIILNLGPENRGLTRYEEVSVWREQFSLTKFVGGVAIGSVYRGPEFADPAVITLIGEGTASPSLVLTGSDGASQSSNSPAVARANKFSGVSGGGRLPGDPFLVGAGSSLGVWVSFQAFGTLSQGFRPKPSTRIASLSFTGPELSLSSRLVSIEEPLRLKRGLPKSDISSAKRRTAQILGSLGAAGANRVAEPLREAALFVPMLLSQVNLDAENFKEAADWLRLVFDWQLESGNQAIYPGVSSTPRQPDSIEEWLADPVNPHGIAAIRPGVYRRWVVSRAIQLLLEWSKSEFDVGGVESRALAVEVLETAETLLDDPAVRAKDYPEGEIENFLEELRSGIFSGSESDAQALAFEARISESWGRIRSLLFRRKARFAALQAKSIGSTGNEKYLGAAEAVESVLATFEAATGWRKSVLTLLNHLDPADASENPLEAIFTFVESNPGLRTSAETAKGMLTADTRRGIDLVPGSNNGLTLASPGNSVIPSTGTLWDSPPFVPTVAEIDDVQDPSYGAFVRGFVPGTGVVFCAPNDPTFDALRWQVDELLWKLRNGRTRSGEVAPFEALSLFGRTSLGDLLSRAQDAVSGAGDKGPQTQFRFPVLLAEARRVANVAKQIEADYQQVLGQRENEGLQRLRLRQRGQTTALAVSISERRIRVAEAQSRVSFRQIVKSSELANDYSKLIRSYPSPLEQAATTLFGVAAAAQV